MLNLSIRNYNKVNFNTNTLFYLSGFSFPLKKLPKPTIS